MHNKFQGETIITQYSLKNKRPDAYMPEYKIGIEIDEYNQNTGILIMKKAEQKW